MTCCVTTGSRSSSATSSVLVDVGRAPFRPSRRRPVVAEGLGGHEGDGCLDAGQRQRLLDDDVADVGEIALASAARDPPRKGQEGGQVVTETEDAGLVRGRAKTAIHGIGRALVDGGREGAKAASLKDERVEIVFERQEGAWHMVEAAQSTRLDQDYIRAFTARLD
jgi:hypothetical protein